LEEGTEDGIDEEMLEIPLKEGIIEA